MTATPSSTFSFPGGLTSSPYNETAVLSAACVEALHDLLLPLQSSSYAWTSTNLDLAMASEASSHPSGVDTLLAQPYYYGGGGLGNMDECYRPMMTNVSSVSSSSSWDLHTCLAGAGVPRDSLIFASLCVPNACTAHDLASPDFDTVVHHFATTTTTTTTTTEMDQQQQHDENAMVYATSVHKMTEILHFLKAGWVCGEFSLPIRHLWPWGCLHLAIWMALLVAAYKGTTTSTNRRTKKTRNNNNTGNTEAAVVASTTQERRGSQSDSTSTNTSSCTSGGKKSPKSFLSVDDVSAYSHRNNDNNNNNNNISDNSKHSFPTAASSTLTTATTDDDEEDELTGLLLEQHQNHHAQQDEKDPEELPHTTAPVPHNQRTLYLKHFIFRTKSLPLMDSLQQQQQQPLQMTTGYFSSSPSSSSPIASYWSAFDVTAHWHKLTKRRSNAMACLDGLRVMSLLWIVFGHVIAIISTLGPGPSDPGDLIPPHGFTTTLLGQLVFSSRLAVDTFLLLSGFLVVHGLNAKCPLEDPPQRAKSVWWRYMTQLPPLVLFRLVRIVPLYAMCLTFYTQIAPYLGSGPFWYQWIALLEPCQKLGWANLLFVNNFLPFDTPVTETCFYHSWYLAVDMQLFFCAPLLVFWHQANPRQGKHATLFLCALSVVMTAYLTYVRHWSMNTFDGAAVARFDIEAYAKPHVRAQSYLAGMFVGMILPAQALQQQPRPAWTLVHSLLLGTALMVMAAVSFVTATGAYARRACQYNEWPEKDECGSQWSSWTTFLYTAFGRPLWTASVAVLMHLCLGRGQTTITATTTSGSDADAPQGNQANVVASFLSWSGWTPLAHLSFGAYLIHPIIIFMWQLGGRHKQEFRLFTVAMDYISVCIVSYTAALWMALLIEFPCASLFQKLVKATTRARKTTTSNNSHNSGTLHADDPVPSNNGDQTAHANGSNHGFENGGSSSYYGSMVRRG